MKRLLLGAVALLAVTPAPAVTSTFISFTFSDLVATADTIAETTVIDVRPRLDIVDRRRVIVTDVTVAVAETLKGTLPRTVTVTFLGGRVGPEEMVVAGAPRFQAGDRDVLFLETRGSPLSPVLGMGQGRFRLARDSRTGGTVVRRADGKPLGSIAEIGASGQRKEPALIRGVSLEEFKRNVRDVLASRGGGR